MTLFPCRKGLVQANQVQRVQSEHRCRSLPAIQCFNRGQHELLLQCDEYMAEIIANNLQCLQSTNLLFGKKIPVNSIGYEIANMKESLLIKSSVNLSSSRHSYQCPPFSGSSTI